MRPKHQLSVSQLLLAAFVISGIYSTDTWAQFRAARVASTKQQIKAIKPSISEATLNTDLGTVHSAYQKVKPRLEQSGFTDEEIQDATLAGWVMARSKLSANEPLNESTTASETAGHGLLVVDSTPREADVFINSTRCSTRTMCKKWVPHGQYDVSLKKQGYQDERGKPFVKAGEKETFHINLRPIKAK